MYTVTINKVLLFTTVSCCVVLLYGGGECSSVSDYPLQIFKKGRGLMGIRIHPRNCPGGVVRKRNFKDVPNIKDTASITEVYLENKQISLGTLYKLVNKFLDLKDQRPVETFEKARVPVETIENIEKPVVTFEDLDRPGDAYDDLLYDHAYNFDEK